MSRRFMVGSSFFDKRQANRAEFFLIWQPNTARLFPNASRIVIIFFGALAIPEDTMFRNICARSMMNPKLFSVSASSSSCWAMERSRAM